MFPGLAPVSFSASSSLSLSSSSYSMKNLSILVLTRNVVCVRYEEQEQALDA
jgi:hypothetical protein